MDLDRIIWGKLLRKGEGCRERKKKTAVAVCVENNGTFILDVVFVDPFNPSMEWKKDGEPDILGLDLALAQIGL